MWFVSSAARPQRDAACAVLPLATGWPLRITRNCECAKGSSTFCLCTGSAAPEPQWWSHLHVAAWPGMASSAEHCTAFTRNWSNSWCYLQVCVGHKAFLELVMAFVWSEFYHLVVIKAETGGCSLGTWFAALLAFLTPGERRGLVAEQHCWHFWHSYSCQRLWL